jgi:hypothetical protein
MARALTAINGLISNEHGQDLLEYSLVAVLIGIAAMVTVGRMGDLLNTLWWGPIARAF